MESLFQNMRREVRQVREKNLTVFPLAYSIKKNGQVFNIDTSPFKD